MKNFFVKLGIMLKSVNAVKNWHIPILYYFGMKDGEIVIEMKNKLKCIIRDKSDSIAFYENFFLNTNNPTKIFEIGVEDIVIDVGAHIGTFTLNAANKAKKGKIIALEPSKETYKILKKNIEINNFKNIISQNIGIWKKTDEIPLYIDENESIGNNIFQKTKKIEKINVISILDCIERYHLEKIDFLKMDCEGAEFEIILGMSDSTLKKIKKISMEVHGGIEKFGIDDLKTKLEKNDFLVTIKQTFVEEKLSMLYAANINKL